MKKAIAPNRFGDLLKLFGSLETLHVRLLKLIQAKIDAMKQADATRIGELTRQEQEVAQRIHEREGFRRQLMDAIGGQLGLPPRAARVLSVSQLAARIPEPQHAKLVSAADRLRARVARVAAANHVAGAVARQIVNHLKWVFAAVRPAGDGTEGYSGKGVLLPVAETRVFDTVG